jgi:hypothetical protein
MISFVMFTLSMIKQAGLKASILFVVDVFFDNDRGGLCRIQAEGPSLENCCVNPG